MAGLLKRLYDRATALGHILVGACVGLSFLLAVAALYSSMQYRGEVRAEGRMIAMSYACGYHNGLELALDAPRDDNSRMCDRFKSIAAEYGF